ncbi:MAG: ParB/RepB/Spo0J family partition protein [Phycisphaerales bacterium]|nr:ParB/RepB/Spo0J family partition protein [Phycisphaerales bacterium]
MSKAPARLGRGLSALVSNRRLDTPLPLQHAPPVDAVLPEIPLDTIRPNPKQPRTLFDDQALAELAASVRQSGVLQPVLVRPVGDDQFELVAGERRWRAARLAGLMTIPAIVRSLDDRAALEIALVENLQREDLGPLERATAYQNYLHTFGGTVEELAQRLGESRANVSNYLRLLKLSPEVCFMLGAGELGMGQARALAGVVDPQRQLAMARLVARRNLSVRQVEELVRQATETDPIDPPATRSARLSRGVGHLADVERSLSKALGLRVRLVAGRRKNSGRIVITYNNLDEFDRIAQQLGGEVHLEE